MVNKLWSRPAYSYQDKFHVPLVLRPILSPNPPPPLLHIPIIQFPPPPSIPISQLPPSISPSQFSLPPSIPQSPSQFPPPLLSPSLNSTPKYKILPEDPSNCFEQSPGFPMDNPSVSYCILHAISCCKLVCHAIYCPTVITVITRPLLVWCVESAYSIQPEPLPWKCQHGISDKMDMYPYP